MREKTRISKAGIEEIVSNGFDSIALEIRFSILDAIQSRYCNKLWMGIFQAAVSWGLIPSMN